LAATEHFDDPVAAYSRLAPHYAEVTRRRESYLRSIEQIIISRIPMGVKSLLDIGAGNGTRSLRIAREAGIPRVVLVEPSPEMAAPLDRNVEIWNIRAEDIEAHVATSGDLRNQVDTKTSTRFDVITCLWNVLGHIRGFQNRVRAMCAMRALLAPEGKCFVDVNHRYNMRSYGLFPSAARFIRDSTFYSQTNADVIARWSIGGDSISTHGHMFIDREIRQLARAAGLSIQQRVVVDYDSGEIRQFAFAGNLLYVFRRSSEIDSASAAHTS
jgi:SAM-dependent methyltransferase